MLTSLVRALSPTGHSVRVQIGKFLYSTSSQLFSHDAGRIRNIGIIAHIDAGKTTVTERMLFNAGVIEHIGDVDDGNTVTDFLEQERDRGITVNSAVISYRWMGHNVNIIDTPGHIDFTMEVERSLLVLDGAVLVIDSSAGAEAQTVVVCRQAARHKLPLIAFLSKMDKFGASFLESLRSLGVKIACKPLPLFVPIGSEKSFCGIIDVLRQEQLLYHSSKFQEKPKWMPLSEEVDNSLVKKTRKDLFETLADYDEEIANILLSGGSADDVPIATYHRALKTGCLSANIVPVVCGSAMKNIGVRSLQDAMIRFLPSPSLLNSNEVRATTITTDLPQCNAFKGILFKFQFFKNKGLVAFVRIYAGSLKVGQSVYNLTRSCHEKIKSLWLISGDSFDTIRSAHAGDIVAVGGLNMAVTGDSLVGIRSEDNLVDELLNIVPIEVPEPVFSCVVEAESPMKQKQLENALSIMGREDPSLKVVSDSALNQTILSGMGELHLEIVKDRLLKEHGVDAFFGPLEIEYRETVSDLINFRHTYSKVIGSSVKNAVVWVTITPAPNLGKPKSLNVDIRDEESVRSLTVIQKKALTSGMLSALAHGPLNGSSFMDVLVTLTGLIIHPAAQPLFLSNAMYETVVAALKENHDKISLLEPFIKLDITVEKEHSANIVQDLTGMRRATIQSVETDLKQTMSSIEALCPLIG